MNDYLKVVYNGAERPYTSYPARLARYLFDEYELKKGMKLLEIGCGRGEFLAGFKNLELDVAGADISPEASKFQPAIPIVTCDIESQGLPMADASFDIVYSKSLLEHMRDPGSYMKEAIRVLKPGGLLLTMVPDWESNYLIYFDDYTHRTPFSLISLTDIYKIFELEQVSTRKFRQLPVVWKYPVLNYLCAAIAPFVPVRTKIPFLRWSRELMLIGSGRKPGT